MIRKQIKVKHKPKVKPKRKSMVKTGMKIPGEALLKHVEFGLPKVNGVYFTYYKPQLKQALSHHFPLSSYGFAVFQNGEWLCNTQILAFIGPMPMITLDEIMSGYTDNELSLHVYYIGTLKGAVRNTWKHGPFHESVYIPCSPGEFGDFGFEVNQRTTLPLPISRFSKKANKWLSIENPKKIIERMRVLREEME